MVDAGVEACAMEVSSHALVMGRVDGFVFDVAVFLNLGRDHLDFHRDMDDYFEAKASLFTPEHARRGLVDVDDEWGRRLAADRDVPVATLSTDGVDADWCAVGRRAQRRPGSTFRVTGPGASMSRPAARCPALQRRQHPGGGRGRRRGGVRPAAVAARHRRGPRRPRPAGADRRGPGLRGRRRLRAQARRRRAAALATLRPLTERPADRGPRRGRRPRPRQATADGRDRRGRRPTSWWSPTTTRAARTPPRSARRSWPAPAAAPAEVVEIGDRRAAIAEAIGRAGAGDVVLVAGKGHETGQEVAGVVHALRRPRRRARARSCAGDPA